jgi:acetyltransferase
MEQKLNQLFRPKNIALIGATNRQGALGKRLMENLISHSYSGKVYPVNLKHSQLFGHAVYRSVGKIKEKVDLAIIATPAPSVPGLVDDCADAGIKNILILSKGFANGGRDGKRLLQKVKRLAERHDLRILGPNSLGFINTQLGLHATFAPQIARPGRIALITQSGALGASILDWAWEQKVGFSHFIGLGDTIGVGFADLIDFLGQDSNTSSILIYMESIQDARRFMSAARSFARTKPILVLKAGSSTAGARASLTHTGSIAGNDAAFEAAFNRAGIVRVKSIAQLFHCAQALDMQARPDSNRLAILSNAGGPTILATDHLVAGGGKVAKLSKETQDRLRQLLPNIPDLQNPVDMQGDATTEDFQQSLATVLDDPGVDGVLIVYVPQETDGPDQVARSIIPLAQRSQKPVLACWMGETEVMHAREILENGRVPNYRYPESAIDVFLYMWRYSQNLKLLMETPSEIPHRFQPDKEAARRLIEEALSKKQFSLPELEAKALLAAYQIDTPPIRLANSENAAKEIAKEIGFPVALKVALNQVEHKTEFGGIKLNLESARQVGIAYSELMENTRTHRPDLEIRGILVEPMIEKEYELIIGSRKDPILGPLILFGMGGMAVEVFKDLNVGIPPLNMALAQRIIEGTRIYQLLRGFRGLPKADLPAIQFVLYKFAYLVMDFPEITELEINPFAVDGEGGMVLDAKVMLEAIETPTTSRYSHLIISPYPEQYQKKVTLKNGKQVLLRPIRPEDEPLEIEMFNQLSKESVYFRFFGSMPTMSHEIITRFTQIDYDREMAIVGILEEAGEEKMVGVVRLVGDAWNDTAEYAIVVADPWHGQGLGTMMTDYIIEIARDWGIKRIVANVLNNNKGMLRIFRNRGFRISREDYETSFAELKLT